MADASEKNVLIPLSNVTELATEIWRYERFLDGSGETLPLPARHFLRQMHAFLDKIEIKIMDLTGKDYEPGLAVEVVDIVELSPSEDDPKTGREIIDEMIGPVILQGGMVITHGKVILRLEK